MVFVNIQTIILTLTATSTALIAGLFFAYSFSVNPGLARLEDAAYLSAMQSINRAIQNPVFFAAFLGTLILLPLSAWLHYSQPVTLRFWMLLASSLIYAAGVFGVTVLGNVPLNDVLDGINLQTSSAQDIAAQRAAFEIPWNRLNAIRTAASAVSVILVIMACLIPTSSGRV